MFYPPLAHYVAVLLHAVGPNLVLASHIAAMLALVLSGVLQLGVITSCTGSRTAGIASAGFYLLFPYRFEQLQVRGAFAEGWVLVWLPLIFLGALSVRQWRHVLWWWPVSMGLALLSHTVFSLWAVPLTVLAAVMARSGVEQRALVTSSAVAVLLGVGLAGFYLLPMWWHMGAVRVADPSFIRATADQVTRSGIEMLPQGFPQTQLAVAVGLCLVVAVLAWVVARKKNRTTRLVTACLVVLSIASFCALAPRAAWQAVPTPLLYIQSPVRLLGISAFLAATVAGLLWARVGPNGPLGRRLLFAGLVVLAWYAGGKEFFSRGVSPSSVMAAVTTSYPDLGFTLDGDYVPGHQAPRALAEQVWSTRKATGTPPLLKWDPVRQEARVQADSGRLVLLPLVGYWFYSVRTADGRGLETTSLNGQLAVTSGGGIQDIRIERRLDGAAVIGVLISGLSALVLLCLHRGGRIRSGAPV